MGAVTVAKHHWASTPKRRSMGRDGRPLDESRKQATSHQQDGSRPCLSTDGAWRVGVQAPCRSQTRSYELTEQGVRLGAEAVPARPHQQQALLIEALLTDPFERFTRLFVPEKLVCIACLTTLHQTTSGEAEAFKPCDGQLSPPALSVRQSRPHALRVSTAEARERERAVLATR